MTSAKATATAARLRMRRCILRSDDSNLAKQTTSQYIHICIDTHIYAYIYICIYINIYIYIWHGYIRFPLEADATKNEFGVAPRSPCRSVLLFLHNLISAMKTEWVCFLSRWLTALAAVRAVVSITVLSFVLCVQKRKILWNNLARGSWFTGKWRLSINHFFHYFTLQITPKFMRAATL